MDLVEEERKEKEILKSFLPEPVSKEELIKIIDESIKETQSSSIKDLGKVMKSVMAKLGGESRWKIGKSDCKRETFPIIFFF